MRRLISGWTSRHSYIASLLGIAIAGSLAGLAEALPVPLIVAAALGVVAAVALAADVFGGLVLGLVGAAAVILLKRLLGLWEPASFWASLGQTLALLATGAAAGAVGATLRWRDPDAPGPVLSGPVFGSLGLLGPDVAMIRLEEEVERARSHRRPLTLVLMATQVSDATLPGPARDAALRAVARLLENRILEADVPFALAEDRLGAIFPETTAAQAWERVGRLLDGVATGRFVDRSTATHHELADAVQVHVGLAQLGSDVSTADALMDVASSALRRSLGDDVKVAQEAEQR